MSKMKYSGVEWIGNIPERWKISKLKYCICSLKSGGTPDSSNMDFYDDENGTNWVAIGDMSTKDLVYSTEKKVTLRGIKDKNLTIFPKGTLIYSIYATIGKVSVLMEPSTINQALLAITPNEKLDNNYMKFLLKSMEEYVLSETSTNTQNNLNANKVNNFIISLPSKEEQQLIANFLDEKVSITDNIVSDIYKEIDILSNFKESIITEKVYNGLHNMELMVTDLKWANKIPNNWEYGKKIKSLFDLSKGLSITKDDLIEDGIPVISYGQVHSKTNMGTSVKEELIRFVDDSYLKKNKNSLLNKGDFIFADTSEDLDGCGNCVYVDKKMILFGGYHTILLKNNDEDNRYFAYLFKTPAWRSQIREKVTAVKVYSITQKILKECKIIIPPKNEQIEIADYLDKKCSQIDAIIEEKKKQIEQMEQYKKSVIYEYVTGKKRVEGAEELYG